jgi:cytokinin riboside 5'-monophosphate phosphoribohydrolase
MTQIAVYCASSNTLDDAYFDAARELGVMMADNKIGLVFGGGNVGLMGELARTMHARGGHVTGVIPERLKSLEGVAYDVADKLIVTESMSDRKSIIWRSSDAYITLAGGVGTLEEFLEILTLKKLGFHNRPIALVNTNGLYDSLLNQFSICDSEGFSTSSTTSMFDVVSQPSELSGIDSFSSLFNSTG